MSDYVVFECQECGHRIRAKTKVLTGRLRAWCDECEKYTVHVAIENA